MYSANEKGERIERLTSSTPEMGAAKRAATIRDFKSICVGTPKLVRAQSTWYEQTIRVREKIM